MQPPPGWCQDCFVSLVVGLEEQHTKGRWVLNTWESWLLLLGLASSSGLGDHGDIFSISSKTGQFESGTQRVQ